MIVSTAASAANHGASRPASGKKLCGEAYLNQLMPGVADSGALDMSEVKVVERESERRNGVSQGCPNKGAHYNAGFVSVCLFN